MSKCQLACMVWMDGGFAVFCLLISFVFLSQSQLQLVNKMRYSRKGKYYYSLSFLMLKTLTKNPKSTQPSPVCQLLNRLNELLYPSPSASSTVWEKLHPFSLSFIKFNYMREWRSFPSDRIPLSSSSKIELFE